VTSGRRNQASPSQSALRGHPRHCSATPGAVATSRRCWDVREQDVAATSAVPRTALVNGTLEPLSHDYAGSNHDARPAAAPSPSLLTPCGRPCHCRATPCTAATTPTLLSARGWDTVTPATIPRTDHCQQPSRARSKPLRSTTTPPPPPRYWHSPQTSGTWRPRLLSRLACSHPSTSTTVQAIQCPEHTAVGRTAPAGTRINQVSLVA
jgi:hypothetical protein